MKNGAFKQVYMTRFERGGLFQVVTNAPVALCSSDHVFPRGAVFDNSVNKRFNAKLYSHFNCKPDLAVLDLGCSGGGFVRSVLEDGYVAVGIEGSNASQRLRAAEWDVIPFHLFTADIASPFTVQEHVRRPGGPGDGQAEFRNMKFDCITAWEVLEHIPEAKIQDLIRNIAEHLKDGGMFVGSVDTLPDGDPLTGAVYHLTLKPKAWWLDQFRRFGLTEIPGTIFETRDFVRGHGMGLKDWDPADGDGFHLVLGPGKQPSPA